MCGFAGNQEGGGGKHCPAIPSPLPSHPLPWGANLIHVIYPEAPVIAIQQVDVHV